MSNKLLVSKYGHEWIAYRDQCQYAFENAATRLNMDPVELAEALSDGGIAEMAKLLAEARVCLQLSEPRAWDTIEAIKTFLATLPKTETET